MRASKLIALLSSIAGTKFPPAGRTLASHSGFRERMLRYARRSLELLTMTARTKGFCSRLSRRHEISFLEFLSGRSYFSGRVAFPRTLESAACELTGIAAMGEYTGRVSCQSSLRFMR